MKRLITPSIALWAIFIVSGVTAQTNMFLSNPAAVEILKGHYDPAQFRPSVVINDPDSVRMGIIRNVSPDELIGLLVKLETFYNRNSGSDTLSGTTGIGACRTWILSHFDQASKDNQNRLVTGYLEFDAEICTKGHHKNPFALLPGSDTSNHEILLIEGHFDTRNEGGCDIQGYTPGIDDNGSGTVLVMELARVMSKYSFRQSILFTTPTGEDEGLWGAKAWANYLSGQGVKIRAVLNNDIVGGIYCGKTSSPPSCPYLGHVDSTHVRIFSYSSANSMFANSSHKQLARYMKYIQDELINPYLSTPLIINIMLGEDRGGRGGDHTPFRQKGYAAVRIISANEHGNGTGTAPDRNHTTRDILGKDLNGDGILDSLFVNPGYLARNTILNGVTAGLLALAPAKISASLESRPSGAIISLPGGTGEADGFIVGIRKNKSKSLEFDSVFRVTNVHQLEIGLDSGQRNYVSIAPVKNGAPGLFSDEYEVNLTGTEPLEKETGFKLYQNYPNPWVEETFIRLKAPQDFWYKPAVL
ncbi:MAG: M28 family peptidase, partial [Bacteroidales bacterium]